MDQDSVSCLQGYCPAVFVIILFVCHTSFCWNRSAFLWAHLPHSLNFCMYLVEVGMVTEFGAKPKVTSMGKWGYLPYMR